MTENCNFLLDFVSSNGFLLDLCTSLLGKQTTKNQPKTLERKQKLFQGFIYFKKLHNTLWMSESSQHHSIVCMILIYHTYQESQYIVY